MLSVRIGDTNVGYRVVAVRKGAFVNESIIMAERVSDRAPSQYVVWTFDHRPGGGFKSGIYEDDRSKAQEVFESRET